MSLVDLSRAYEQMRFERDLASGTRDNLVAWVDHLEAQHHLLYDEVIDRLRTLTYLMLEDHVWRVKLANLPPTLPHWTVEQRAALRRGLGDRRISISISEEWLRRKLAKADDSNAGAGNGELHA